MPLQTLNLVPPLIQEGRLAQFLYHGQTVSFSLSPRSNSLAIYACPKEVGSKADTSGVGPQDVYTAMRDKAPTSERRVFVTDTSIIFAALRKLIESSRSKKDIRSRDYIVAFRKLAGDFITHAKDSWVYASQLALSSEGPPQYQGSHYKNLYTAFSLFQSIYLPEDGEEDVPVGDELLDWLNTHFIDPSNEEADQLGSSERPWENEIFWSYVTRATIRGLVKLSVFFLRSLESHPSENLQRIGKRLVDLLEKHPRQKHVNTEQEFHSNSRRWRDRVRSLRIELDRVPEDDRNDGFENWWDNVSDLIGVMEGREEVLQRACVALGGGWKDIVCAHGVWTDIGLRRSELPNIVNSALTNAPPDPTDREDVFHADLFLGKGVRALGTANDIDVWLSAHLAEFMLPLGILSQGVDDVTAKNTRDVYVLNYADYLHSDPGLWRLTVDYLCTCGDAGKEVADEVLMRVPLNINDLVSSVGKRREPLRGVPMEIEADTQDVDGDLSGVVQELNATCHDYEREHTRRAICRVASQKLMRLEKYGLAVSYSKSAEDWAGIGRIVDIVLEKFIIDGPLRYVSLVSDIAPLLRELKKDAGPHGVFVQRLEFAIRYAEFHQHNNLADTENAASALMSIFEENLSPRSWWAVLLNDAIPLLQDETSLFIPSHTACLLLRRLEEVAMRAAQGDGDDYLSILARVLKVGGQKEALRRMDLLRLALARYLARSALMGSHTSSSRYAHELLA